MRRRPSYLWHLLLSLGVLSCPRAALADAGTDDREKALEYFRLGNEAFAEGDLLQAYTEYRTAWLLHRTFDIACNLGRTEAELNKARDAAEHLHYCLDNFSASTRPDVRQAESKLRELFDRVRTQVTMLRLVVEPVGAFVTLDGNTVGKAPIDEALFVSPGVRSISVKKAGYSTVNREVTAQGGQSREVRISLTAFAEPAAGPEPAAVAPAADQASSARNALALRTVALIGGGVLTAGGIGIGIGYLTYASSLDGDAKALKRRIQEEETDANSCRGDTGSDCTELRSMVRSSDQAKNIALVSFVGAGVAAAATTAVYLLWRPEKPMPVVVFFPLAGPKTAGLSLWMKL